MAEEAHDDSAETERARRALLEWPANEHLVAPGTIHRWHKGSTYRRALDKGQLASLGMDAVGEGWLPATPLITPATRVLAFGSCFARYFVLWLAEHGFNKSTAHSPYNALLRFGASFENLAAIAQQFRWAFDGLGGSEPLWIAKNKDIFEATEERRLQVREAMLATDVLLLTLGLSEVWYDRVTGEPMWRALTVDQFDPKRHVFRIESMAQTTQWLETIERLRAQHVPGMKIIFTVSPIRLVMTFRPVSALTANSVSKAILRAALDEFLRNHQSALGRDLYYFPSYEIVRDYFVDPYEHDNCHITSGVAASIIRFFVEHYCSADMIERSGRSLSDLQGGGPEMERFLQQSRIASSDPVSGGMLGRIAELESKVVDLQRICDARQEVIAGLDQAARERLEIINLLDAEIRRQKVPPAEAS